VYNDNNTSVLKKQGIFYNTDFGRWEYYSNNPVIRAGEPQPGFVSADYEKCVAYKMKVEGAR
jgi:hypothetical protein